MKEILLLAIALLILGCSDQKSENVQKEIGGSIEKITKVVKEESSKISSSVKKVTKNGVENIKTEAKSMSKTVLKETKKVAQETAASIDVALQEPTIDGKALFTKCSSCHGVNADKKALNKSKSIKGWSVEKLTTAINGYKDGTYGGSMKGVMKAQVNSLNDAQIKAVSAYITQL